MLVIRSLLAMGVEASFEEMFASAQQMSLWPKTDAEVEAPIREISHGCYTWRAGRPGPSGAHPLARSVLHSDRTRTRQATLAPRLFSSHLSTTTISSSASPAAVLADSKSNIRPTRPLPSSKTRKIMQQQQQTNNPLMQQANPLMLPVQAHVAKSGAASTQRKLYVILEQACLEAYRVTTAGRSKNGREGDVKYALLN